MTAGFFSPLPPARTGVAEYSAALIRAMRRHGDVRVNDPNATAALYHLGNNALHRSIYTRALAHPGVAVLHDAVLHHFFLGALAESEYVDEFVFNYGEWSAQHARSLWARRSRSASDPEYFRYGMLRRIAETSQAVIVHNPAAARAVREHAPSARVYQIPHLFEPPPEPGPVAVDRLRTSLGVPGSTTLFAVFGHLRESKRLATVLRVLDGVRRQAPAALLVAGDFVSREYERAISPLLRNPGVIRVPSLPEREWWLYAHAVDCCINLRAPSAGETSGIAVRLMGIGKPVIFTEGLETSDLPEGCSIRIDAGPAEAAMLSECLLWVARRRHDARQMGALARDHIRTVHDPERVARLFWSVLENPNRSDTNGPQRGRS